VEYDTGVYIARWFEGTLEVSRSTVYGLFLVALDRPDFWPAVVVQTLLTVSSSTVPHCSVWGTGERNGNH